MTNEFNRENFADAAEEKVAGLLSSLPAIEAPRDFDVRVRARIAQRRGSRSSWVPRFAGVAVPAALAIAMGGYYFGTSSSNRPATAPAVADAGVTTAPAPVVSAEVQQPAAPQQTQPITEEAKTIETKPQAPVANAAPVQVKKKVEPKTTPSGGTLPDQAGGPGSVLTATNAAPPNSLKRLMDAGLKLGDGKTVQSAPSGSGLKAGDVIVNVGPSSVTVRRDGKSLVISVK